MGTKRICLSVSAWPETEAATWARGTTRAALFEDAGAGAAWSPRSRDKTERGYGRWLRFLLDAGMLDLSQRPDERVTKEVIERYIKALKINCAPYTVATRIQELCDALAVLAPHTEFGWLWQLYGRLARDAVPISNKRARLKPAYVLLDLGMSMMDEAQAAAGWSPRRRAVHYRDGLIIAFLARRLVRMGSLMAMRLGQQLVNIEGRWWLNFSSDDMKARRASSADFPEMLAPALTRYLDHHRPILQQGPKGMRPVVETDGVWVSDLGTKLTQKAMSARISAHTKAAFGASVPPHWFRDAGATTTAIDNSQHIRDVTALLDHTKIETGQKYYNQATSLIASRRHSVVIADLRASFKNSYPNLE